MSLSLKLEMVRATSKLSDSSQDGIFESLFPLINCHLNKNFPSWWRLTHEDCLYLDVPAGLLFFFFVMKFLTEISLILSHQGMLNIWGRDFFFHFRNFLWSLWRQSTTNSRFSVHFLWRNLLFCLFFFLREGGWGCPFACRTDIESNICGSKMVSSSSN